MGERDVERRWEEAIVEEGGRAPRLAKKGHGPSQHPHAPAT